jgi:glycosyltransferase involved in cell wall biosynthesis
VRIGINLTQFVPGKSGGVQTYAESLVGGLCRADLGHTFVLFVNYLTAPLFEHLRSERCELVFVAPKISRLATRLDRLFPGVAFRAYAAGLNAIMAGARLDVLHFPQNFIVPWKYPGRTVVTFHDLQQEYHPEFFTEGELAWRRRNYLPSARKATHLISISRFTAASLVERYGIPPDRITTVHTGAGDDVAAPLAPPGPAAVALPPRFFYYPAAFWPHKNHARLFEAMARLRPEGFDLPLLLTGMDAADAAPVHRDLARLGLEGQVRLLGYQPRQEVLRILRGAEFMIFPSLFEGFGIPVVEAMAAGCPVACARATSLPEVVGEDGLLFDPRDVGEMTDVLRRLWKDAGLRERLRERLRPRARLFTVDRMARETAAVYERVAAGAAGSGGAPRRAARTA